MIFIFINECIYSIYVYCYYDDIIILIFNDFCDNLYIVIKIHAMPWLFCSCPSKYLSLLFCNSCWYVMVTLKIYENQEVVVVVKKRWATVHFINVFNLHFKLQDLWPISDFWLFLIWKSDFVINSKGVILLIFTRFWALFTSFVQFPSQILLYQSHKKFYLSTMFCYCVRRCTLYGWTDKWTTVNFFQILYETHK